MISDAPTPNTGRWRLVSDEKHHRGGDATYDQADVIARVEHAIAHGATQAEDKFGLSNVAIIGCIRPVFAGDTVNGVAVQAKAMTRYSFHGDWNYTISSERYRLP